MNGIRKAAILGGATGFIGVFVGVARIEMGARALPWIVAGLAVMIAGAVVAWAIDEKEIEK